MSCKDLNLNNCAGMCIPFWKWMACRHLFRHSDTQNLPLQNLILIIWVVCCLVIQSCLTLCDPMNCSTPGFSVHHCLPEFAQTHVHRVGDAIQPSHPLLYPSPAVFSLSQHQGLFQCKSKDLKFYLPFFFLNVHYHCLVWYLIISIISLIFLLCNINLYLYTKVCKTSCNI